MAGDLIRLDKINEMSGGEKSRLFFKKIYDDIVDLYSSDSHYWLQRAKVELISAPTIDEIKEGISHAQKVRLDNGRLKNQTYYSATLVLAQIYAKAYAHTKENIYLINFIKPCCESIENYQHNKKHVDAMRDVNDVLNAVDALATAKEIDILTHKQNINQIQTFFIDRRTKKKTLKKLSAAKKIH
jgi:hypothetical protein